MQELDHLYEIPIVCFIDNWAISAGAMLAYSSRFIATTSQSSMGAAEPITISQEGTQTALWGEGRDHRLRPPGCASFPVCRRPR